MLNAVVAELGIYKVYIYIRQNFLKVLSDERLGAKLRVTENRCVLFDSFTYIYIYLFGKKIDGSAYAQFSNTPTHLQPDPFPILFLPDAELPSLEEIHSITKG